MAAIPIFGDLADLPLLQGARVTLRALRDDDVDALFALHADPDVMRYWSRLPMTDRAEAAAQIDTCRRGHADRTHACWAITRRGQDTLIGTVTLFAFRIDQGRCELGYALAQPHWGRGYAREAVTLVVEHAFESLGLTRIEADVDPRNGASIALLERLGFEREGLLRERWRVGGVAQDSAIYGLLRSDWRHP